MQWEPSVADMQRLNGKLAKLTDENERLQAELSWIYCHCELRDGDNTHVDSDDVQAAVAEEYLEADKKLRA
jgi:hypothetical protein